MPSLSRERSAVASADVRLADWARGEGLDASPDRVRRWRRAGLLPTPSSMVAEAGQRGLGRPARTYTDEEWRHAQENLRFLVRHTRRGRPVAEMAVLLFAAGLSIEPGVVVDAVNAVMAAAKTSLEQVQVKAQAFAESVPSGMRLDEVFEKSAALSRMMIGQRTELARSVRQNLRKAGLPHSDADVETVLVACSSAAYGAPPDSADHDALNALLYGVGAHGLVESAADGIEPIVSDGVEGVADALTRATRAAMTPLPSDVTDLELSAARDMLQEFSAMFQSLPGGLLHFVGGSAVADIWKATDPIRAAQAVTWAVNARRNDSIDPRPVLDAAREAGWLPPISGGTESL